MLLDFPKVFVLQIFMLFVMLVYAQHWNDHGVFMTSLNNDITSFHNFLTNIKQIMHDQQLASSNAKKGSKHSKSDNTEGEKGGYKKTGGSKEHHKDRGQKFNSEKENRKKQWGEKKGKDTHYKTGKHHGGEHHQEEKHQLEDAFKDAHKHNKGNYEKGFREQYHLDETKKHRQFWKHGDSHKKWKHFGDKESEHDEGGKGKTEHAKHKENSSDSKDAKAGKKAKTVLSAQSHGHKKEEGHEITYSHEKKLHQR